jgi:uncharacterized membrane protein YbjE (DUF340 family)
MCQKFRIEHEKEIKIVLLINMFTILAFMALGILAGRLLRRYPLRRLPVCLTALVWLLLFVLGIQAGSNPQVVRHLPTLGLEALALAVGGTLGSLWLARALQKRLFRKRSGDEEKGGRV